MKFKRPTEQRVPAAEAVGMPEHEKKELLVEQWATPAYLLELEQLILHVYDKAYPANNPFEGFSGNDTWLSDLIFSRDIINAYTGERIPNPDFDRRIEKIKQRLSQELLNDLGDLNEEPNDDNLMEFRTTLGHAIRLNPDARNMLEETTVFKDVAASTEDLVESYNGGVTVNDFYAAAETAMEFRTIDPQQSRTIGMSKRFYELIRNDPEAALKAADDFHVFLQDLMRLRLLHPERELMNNRVWDVIEANVHGIEYEDRVAIAALCVLSAETVVLNDDGSVELTRTRDSLASGPELPKRPAI